MFRLFKRFLEIDSSYKRFYIDTFLNHILAKAGLNGHFDMFDLRENKWKNNKLTYIGKLYIDSDLLMPFDTTHNLKCPKCKRIMFDYDGKIRNAKCLYCDTIFNGLDRKNWHIGCEDFDYHIKQIEKFKKDRKLRKRAWGTRLFQVYFDRKNNKFRKLEGFKRSIAAIENGEKWILCKVYSD